MKEEFEDHLNTVVSISLVSGAKASASPPIVVSQLHLTRLLALKILWFKNIKHLSLLLHTAKEGDNCLVVKFCRVTAR